MQSLLTLVIPLVVAALAQGLKRYVLPLLTQQVQVHNAWVVLGVAVLSFLLSVGQGAVAGNFDPMSAQTLVTAIVSFLGATGVFHLGSRAKMYVGARIK